jgi:hypothetical protein
LSNTSSHFGHPHGALERLIGRGRPSQRPSMVSHSLLRSFLRESLRAMAVGLASTEPMAAAYLAETEAVSAPADAANGWR